MDDDFVEPVVCAYCGNKITGPHIVDDETLETFCSSECVEFYDEPVNIFIP